MNNKRPNYIFRIVGCVFLLLLSQAAAGYIVVLLHGMSLFGQGLDVKALDEAILELMLAHETEMLLISYVIVAAVLLIVAKRRKEPFGHYTGLRPGASPAFCLLGVMAGVAAAFWFSIALNLIPWPESLMEAYTEESSALTTAMPGLDMLAVVVLGPLVEEILFRGLIYRYLCLMLPAGAAVVLQGILFGGVHSAVIWMLYAGLAGCIFGYVRKQTGSLWPSILMHMAFNGSSYLFDWFAQAYGEDSVTVVIVLLVSAFLMLLALYGINFRAAQRDAQKK